jgi:GxxExxY protein
MQHINPKVLVMARRAHARKIKNKKTVSMHTLTVKGLQDHAIRVMKSLGKGHTERVYHRAMITSLNKDGIRHRSEVQAPIFFMNEIVGTGRCDLVVGDLVVEIKANTMPPSSAASQLWKYTYSLARAEQCRYSGVILNFNQKTGVVQTLQGKPCDGTKY